MNSIMGIDVAKDKLVIYASASYCAISDDYTSLEKWTC